MNNETIKLGQTVVTKTNEEYTFVFDPYEEYTPYYQIDLNYHSVVDAFPEDIFNEIKVGYKLEVGGEITAILY